MNGLIEFLRARLDEDEAVARAAGAPEWERSARGDTSAFGEEIVALRPREGGRTFALTYEEPHEHQSKHIVRHDPARVLREVEAKRAIVEWCAEVIGDRDLGAYGRPGLLAADGESLAVTLAVETLRGLVGVYSGQRGFRPEWGMIADGDN